MTKQQTTDAMAEALETARATVRTRWPEFADVDPQVSQRVAHELHPADAGRLGVNGAANGVPDDAEYIFTFAREIRTPEGYTIPRIARVTVDSDQHVVKAVLSK